MAKNEDLINNLTDEYQAWFKAQGLPAMSADELLVQTKTGELDDSELITTEEQRTWLTDFITRWDKASDY